MTMPATPPAEQRWIAVSERLPDKNVHVLAVWVQMPSVGMDVCELRDDDIWYEADPDSDQDFAAPTHWMKLPEPPK